MNVGVKGKMPQWADTEVQKDQTTGAKLLVENDGTMSPE
jgi:hypothetical protein